MKWQVIKGNNNKVLPIINQFFIFRFKLIKWWAQSFLVGIPQIICGFRDDEGIVHRLEKFNVQEIPNIVRVNTI